MSGIKKTLAGMGGFKSIFISAFLFFELERTGDIKTKEYITIAPVEFGGCQEGSFVHAFGIGKMKLEHVSAGFNIKSK